MSSKRVQSALISVFHKEGLAPIVQQLHQLGITIYSTGGTQAYIESLDIPVVAVENLTTYPSILDGRVKTLHPKVFGGILARREAGHLQQLEKYDIPELDLVIVDLYPFEETVANTDDESTIIEKIDIGGISLIRAAAKNYRDVVIVPSQEEYDFLLKLLTEKEGMTDLADRHYLASRAFGVSAHYDTAIYQYFSQSMAAGDFKVSVKRGQALRYGENPHQQGSYYGALNELFDKLNGKELSFNNLVDIDAAVQLMREFKDDKPTFAVLKHTNACGLAVRNTVVEAWEAALAGDPVSAFGGIFITNTEVDLATAAQIDKLFYEVLIAPSFAEDAFELLSKKRKRVLLQQKAYPKTGQQYKSLLNGVIVQDADTAMETAADLKVATEKPPSDAQIQDLLFANKLCKHLKSNTIVLTKDHQLLGMGCGQTSRVDALKQAIEKANRLGFSLEGAVMASDAFFPFPDCVEIADKAGIVAVIQPGGSIKDQLSIDYCNENGMSMVMTGVRHFKH
ncbi:MAG: bifunctional phosphoribosylaminoimidazolecarboxamide formyltransferase/IMP cyclohydrolase [Bacteroidota bacterium]